MRILHTSDWHLGRSFGPISLANDQQAFIDWMIGQCAAQSIELVVIAGDIFDRAVAPTESVVMFRGALRRLQAAEITVAVITGNHDGADRVFAYDDLLDRCGVLIRGGYSKIGEVLSVTFTDGPLDLVMLPFLDPQSAPDDLPLTAHEPETDAFERRRRRTHQSVLEAAIAAARPNVTSPRSLAIAHAFVAGAAASDSERQLSIGGTGTVDASLFSEFSYTALGHLHRPQVVSANGNVRYSGTPLAYSFSEDHPKSVTIIDMAPDGACSIETVPIPVGRPVATIRGTMDELLGAGPSAHVVGSLVRAVVTDRGVVLDARQRLSAVYPHVVEIVLDPPLAAGATAGAAIDRRQVSATQAADAFWVASVGSEPSDDERVVLHEAIAEAEAKVA